jgi:hypothetical protein
MDRRDLREVVSLRRANSRDPRRTVLLLKKGASDNAHPWRALIISWVKEVGTEDGGDIIRESVEIVAVARITGTCMPAPVEGHAAPSASFNKHQYRRSYR